MACALSPAGMLSRRLSALAAVAMIGITGTTYAQLSLPVPSAVSPVQVASPPPPEPKLVASPWDAPEPWRTDRFYFETSLYTKHFSSDAKHDDHQNLILVEWNITEQWLFGVSVFDNSFGQSSQYVYGGYRFRPFESLQPLYFKVAAGIVHGYSGQYQNKIPFNASGFAPAIVPSMGYCINRFCSELILFGSAGMLVTFGVTVP
jgi:hypothetical protein